MFSMLIVDDHRHVVDSMAQTLERMPGISTLYKAYNGLEALDIIVANKIDIVITDIRMPGMSGLELIKEAKKYNDALKCIVLTGYAQFEYAKKAIELQAVDYLIKPVKDEEIIVIVGNIIKGLEDKLKNEDLLETVLMRKNLPLLKNSLLRELLETPPEANHRDLAEKLNSYGLTIQIGEQFRLVLIEMGQEFDKYSRADRGLIEYSVLNIAEEILLTDFDVWSGQSHQDQLVLIIRWPAEWNETQLAHLKEKWAKIRTNVQNYLKGEASVYVSRTGIFPGEIPAAYREGLENINISSLNGSDFFCIQDELTQESYKVEALASVHRTPNLMQLMDSDNWDGATDKLAAIFEELRMKWPYSQAHMKEAYFHIIGCFMHFAHRKGLILKEIAGMGDVLTQGRGRFRSGEQLEQWACRVLALIREHAVQLDSPHAHYRNVSIIKHYIQENLGGDLSLRTIADHVYLHPVYLSKIYKEATGQNLSEYIYMERMEKARQLLIENQYKIYEIAQRIGYQSTQHFIREFKKHYGVTPKAYISRQS
ncbi:response regulator [Paenibacillaceae bacterium]|nr:response regulator [Paenibacillaceae bacterium]